MSDTPDTQEIPPALATVLASYEANRRHTARAAATILPGPLRRAFAIGLRPGGLRPPSLGDFALLATWGHPLAGFAEGWLAGEAVAVPEMTPEDLDAVSCLWRNDWAAVLSAAESGGRAPFRGQSPEFVLTAEEACAHLLSALETGARLVPPAEEGQILGGAGDGGVGWWLRLYGFALTVLRIPVAELLGYPLAQLVALRVWRDAESGAKWEKQSYVLREEAQRQEAEA